MGQLKYELNHKVWKNVVRFYVSYPVDRRLLLNIELVDQNICKSSKKCISEWLAQNTQHIWVCYEANSKSFILKSLSVI